MRHIPRILLALSASLLAGLLCARLVAAIALFALRFTGPADFWTLAGVLANLVLVPLATGLPIGFIVPRCPLPLAVGTVVLSLLGTYAALGPAGLPTGWKIIQYFLQLSLVYLAARASAHRQLSQASIATGTA